MISKVFHYSMASMAIQILCRYRHITTLTSGDQSIHVYIYIYIYIYIYKHDALQFDDKYLHENAIE